MLQRTEHNDNEHIGCIYFDSEVVFGRDVVLISNRFVG